MARKTKNASSVSAAARTLGATGARKGGLARKKKLNPAERSKIAAMGGKAKARKRKSR